MLFQCISFQSNSPNVWFVLCAVVSVSRSLVVTCRERGDLLALMFVVFCHFHKCSGPPFQGRPSFVDHLCFYVLCLSCFRVLSLLPFGHLPRRS